MKPFREVVADNYKQLQEERERELKETPWYKWDRRRHLKKAIDYYKKMSEKYK